MRNFVSRSTLYVIRTSHHLWNGHAPTFVQVPIVASNDVTQYFAKTHKCSTTKVRHQIFIGHLSQSRAYRLRATEAQYLIISKGVVFDELGSDIGALNFQISTHLSLSQDGEVQVHLSDDLVEEEIVMTECPGQSMQANTAAKARNEGGTVTKIRQILESLRPSRDSWEPL